MQCLFSDLNLVTSKILPINMKKLSYISVVALYFNKTYLNNNWAKYNIEPVMKHLFRRSHC